MRLALPMDFIKQRLADLIIRSKMPPGSLQVEGPLNMKFKEMILHFWFVQHTLNDFTGRFKGLAIVGHDLGRYSSTRGEAFETPKKGSSTQIGH